MIIRKLTIAVATIAALSPALSNASPERTSAKACASAFATSLASPGAGAPAYKLAYRGGFQSAMASFYATDYSFVMEVHDPKTGAAVARATCTTNSHGTVTAMASLPLDSKPAGLATVYAAY